MNSLLETLYNKFKSTQHFWSGDVVRERHDFLLRNILKENPGDILEVGAHMGLSTIIYIKYAIEIETQVHVIDPWDGRSNGTPQVFEEFMELTSRFIDNGTLRLCRAGSETEEATKFAEGQKYSFIFLDGLHTKEAIKGDLVKFAGKCNGIVCIDDVRGPSSHTFAPSIMEGVNEFCDAHGWTHALSPDNFRETYIYKQL